MSDDDTRGNESPDRRDASTPDQTIDPTRPIRTYLETIDRLTRVLHARLRDPAVEIDGEPVAEESRRQARRRCREIRAETSQLGLRLIGPEAAIPYNPDETPSGTGRGVTTFSGPSPGKFDRDLERTPDRDRTSDGHPKTDGNREPDGNRERDESRESDRRTEDDTPTDDADDGDFDD
ncbi:hypothetical protein [Natronorubrum halophilum]|uniref:hypothetical protein n=1 Tax=Natronorubrum halophilum TaxID=1702106 RepID=UPI001EE896BD|nr:hypothetical protein [Natronorubrum halophilum]